jgi:hypothetical protein
MHCVSGVSRVRIIDGYGTFGGHIAAFSEPRLTLIIAARSQRHARAYCRD